MAQDVLQVGDDNRVVVKFTETNPITKIKMPVTPGAVSCFVRAPDGTTVEYAYPEDITKLQAGWYQLIVDCDAEGTWEGYWSATDPGKSTEPFSFEVKALPF